MMLLGFIHTVVSMAPFVFAIVANFSPVSDRMIMKYQEMKTKRSISVFRDRDKQAMPSLTHKTSTLQLNDVVRLGLRSAYVRTVYSTVVRHRWQRSKGPSQTRPRRRSRR